MNTKLIKEFAPSLLFLGKFLAIYFVGNIVYGLFIESYDHQPDPITSGVTHQTAWLLKGLGYEIYAENYQDRAKVALKADSRYVLNVYEGCNGINVFIVFIAFLIAYGGPVKLLAVFIPAGLILIHITNLFRISLLFYLSLEQPDQFYFFHKYFFTITLYLVVILLWALWILRFNGKRSTKAPA